MKNLQALAACAFIAVPIQVQAYEFTGAVKTVPAGDWAHWQEILLEDGDSSVWTPCNIFVDELKRANATVDFSITDCVEVAERLSGVSGVEHNSLPIGTAIWAPFMPVDFVVSSVDDVSIDLRDDLVTLQREFDRVEATYLTETEIAALLQKSEERLEQMVQDGLDDLRIELLEAQDQNNGDLQQQLDDLAEAMVNNQAVPITTTTNVSQETLVQINDINEEIRFLKGLQGQLDELEDRLVARIDDGLATKADASEIERLDGELDGKVDQADFDELNDRVDDLKNAEQPGSHWLIWLALAALTAAMLVLIGFFRKVKGDTEKKIESLGGEVKTERVRIDGVKAVAVSALQTAKDALNLQFGDWDLAAGQLPIDDADLAKQLPNDGNELSVKLKHHSSGEELVVRFIRTQRQFKPGEGKRVALDVDGVPDQRLPRAFTRKSILQCLKKLDETPAKSSAKGSISKAKTT